MTAGISLGNLNSRMRLLCHECGWLPPENLEMALVEAHYGLEHPETEKITLDLKPLCTCGTPMNLTVTRPTGGGFKDHHLCPSCGNTGFVKRDGA